MFQSISAPSLIFALLFSASSSFATEVTVGRLKLEIPQPAGFVPIADENSALARAERMTEPRDFIKLSRLFPESYEQEFQRGTASGPPRSYYAKTYLPWASMNLQIQDFQTVKQHMRKDCTPQDGLAKQLSAAAESLGPRLKDEFGRDPRYAFDVPIVLPVHDETDRSIGCSFVLKVKGKSATGTDMAEVLTFTNLDVLVKGKVLMIVVYGGGSDLEWTRKAARHWADSALAANVK